MIYILCKLPVFNRAQFLLMDKENNCDNKMYLTIHYAYILFYITCDLVMYISLWTGLKLISILFHTTDISRLCFI